MINGHLSLRLTLTNYMEFTMAILDYNIIQGENTFLGNILDYYQTNGLYESKHDYPEKFNNLSYFTHLEKITIESIHDYCSLRKLQGVKNATINRELTILRSAINYYNFNNDTEIKNPLNGFKLFEEDFIPKYLNEYQCKRLLNACSQYSNRTFYVYIYLLLNTGCRSSELLTLEWENVDLDRRFFVVRNSLSKNKKTVYKPINDQALKIFDELSWSHSKWVFYNPKTNYRYKTFRRAWLWTLEKSGLDCRIHDLRHTFASLLVSNGVPIYHVTQLLGHSDTRITQRYAHLSPNNLLSVVNQLPTFSE